MWDKLELNLLHQHGDDKHENEQEHWGAMCHVSKASGLSASVIPLLTSSADAPLASSNLLSVPFGGALLFLLHLLVNLVDESHLSHNDPSRNLI